MTTYTPPPEPGRTGSGRNRPVPFVIGILLALVGFPLYARLEGLDAETNLLSVKIAGGQAAFLFEIITRAGDKTYTVTPIDVMAFDEDGLITSMRAYWGESDAVVR